jgi:hypothetical protein
VITRAQTIDVGSEILGLLDIIFLPTILESSDIASGEIVKSSPRARYGVSMSDYQQALLELFKPSARGDMKRSQ